MAKLKFGGEEYEYVDFGSLNLGEALILHEYSGLTLDEVSDAGFHPGVIMALIHITVARGNPNINKKDLRKQVEKTLMADLEQVFEDVSVDDEADARPPASPVPSGEPPVSDEPPVTVEQPPSSGDASAADSESQVSDLRVIGNLG